MHSQQGLTLALEVIGQLVLAQVLALMPVEKPLQSWPQEQVTGSARCLLALPFALPSAPSAQAHFALVRRMP